MTDLNRNTRTLLLSFVIAIFALVPLRFVEVGQGGVASETVTILGVGDEAGLSDGEDFYYSQEETGGARLEAPYNEIDGNVLGAATEAVEEEGSWSQEAAECISEDEAKTMIEEMFEAGANSEDMQLVANSICR